jgi:two-component system sensor histidine kinase RegB
VVGFGILLVAHRPLAIPEDNRAIGAWVALGVASAFVVHFLLRITGALAERERELTQARGLAARQERLASLATMAAGAAHELSTPLGTVALAAKELERALLKAGSGEEGAAPASEASQELAADARLIREQVGRCRAILEQMAQGAGTVGESVAACTLGELLEEAMVGIREAPAVHRDVGAELARSPVRLPRRAVSQALRSLVTNAQDASPGGAAVVVAVRASDDARALAISIRDRGAGMPGEVLARIGEPFFTTKAPGRGMGLGLFLARAVIEGVGGTLQIDSQAGEGTEVRVVLPTDVTPREVVPATSSPEPVGPAVVSKPA